jgi:hypothetical protein
MKKSFKVACSWTMTGTYKVEADCLADAIDLVKSEKKPLNGLPPDGEYLGDSFAADEETTFDLNPLDDDFELLGNALDNFVMDDE